MITFKFYNLIHAVLKMLYSHAPSTIYPLTHVPYHPCAAPSMCPITHVYHINLCITEQDMCDWYMSHVRSGLHRTLLHKTSLI